MRVRTSGRWRPARPPGVVSGFALELASGLLFCLLVVSAQLPARADETGQSPYLPVIVGQEDFVYVWTQGVDGLGDGSDKLVTIGANPKRPYYGEVVASASVGGRHGAHQGGFSDDRRYLWAGGLADSRVFIFDIVSDPANPELIHEIGDLAGLSGGVLGPQAFHALPDRIMITGLSNARNGDSRTGLVEFSNRGEFLRTTWMPDGAAAGYDAGLSVRMNRMLTSSFAGRNQYTRSLTELLADSDVARAFGHTMVVWDLLAWKPLQILEVPGAPLEVRWALRPRHSYAFTTTMLTSKLWGVFRKDDGSFEAKSLLDIGDPTMRPWPVDLSLSSNDRRLFVSTFRDGTVRAYDVSKPRRPELLLEQKIGSTLARISQSWDGKRLYFTSCLFESWNAPDGQAEYFLKVFAWDNEELEPLFALDFEALGLGRPQSMHLGSIDFYRGRVAGADQPAADPFAGSLVLGPRR
jgi:selenium-binding protein 1